MRLRHHGAGHDEPVTPTDRIVAAMVAGMGLFAVVRNRRFAEASIAASHKYFGIRLREDTRAYRFNWIWSRTIAIVVGSLMVIAGGLGAIGVDWRDIYR